MTERIDVVGAVLVRAGLLLAARRGPAMAQAGLWEFPGGKLEPGESPRDALWATEHAELRWLPATDLPGLDWAPADVPAVERVIRTLG